MNGDPNEIEYVDAEFVDDDDEELQEDYYELQETTQNLEFEFALTSDVRITDTESEDIINQHYDMSSDIDEDVLELEEYFGYN